MNKRIIKKEVAENSIQQVLSAIIELVGGLIFTIFIARLLKPELFGLYSLGLSVTLFLMAFSNLGINEALLRYISVYYSRNNFKKAKTYFVYLTNLKIFVLLFFSVLLLILAKPLSIVYKNENLFMILIFSSGYLFLFSFLRFLSTIFFAFKKVKFYTLSNLFFNLSRLILIPFVLLVPLFFKVSFVFLITSIASIISLFFIFILIKRKYGFLFFENTKKISLKERKILFDYVKYLSIGSISAIFLIYIDVLMLGYFVKTEYIGFYRAAFSIVASLGVLLSFSGVFYSLFTSLEGEDLKRIFNRIFYLISVLSIPVSLGLSFISKPFIVALFGYSYIDAYYPLIILSFFIFTSTSGEIFVTLFNSKGKSKITAISILISTITNIVLNFIFIYYFLKISPLYATIGTSIATVISRFILIFVLLSRTEKELNFKPNLNLLYKPFLASLVMVAFLYIFNHLAYGNLNLLLGIIEILLAMIIYFIILFLIKGFKKEDINFLIFTFKERFIRNNKV